jgi:Carboxypeptidase regulatory-like domain
MSETSVRPFPSHRCATDQEGPEARQSHGRRRSTARRSLAVIVGCAALFALAPVAAAQAAAALEGTVTALKGGTAVAGIDVTATSTGSGTSGSAITSGIGKYTISGLSESGYTVTFVDPTSKYAKQEKSLTLSAGTNPLNATLEETGTLSGRVTNASGAAVSGVSIDVSSQSPSESERFTQTNTNGEYSMAHLAPGGHNVSFNPIFGSGYISETVTTTVTEGAVDTLNVTLKEGAKISGRVTDAYTHSGLAKISACASGSSGSECSSTNSNGEYTIIGLPTGSYKVTFSWEFSEAELKACEHAVQCPPKYITQYFNNQPSEVTANSLGVAEHSTTSGINAAMVPAAPVNTALPVVSGTAKVGDLLSCSNGSWTGESQSTLTVGWPLTTPFAYQWQRAGAAIAGATSPAYLVQAADVGHALVCEVTATNYAGRASAKSSQVAVALPAVSVPSAKIAVAGDSARVPLACASATCAGRIELTGQIVVKSKGKKKTKKKTVVLGKSSYSLAAGKSATVSVHLTAAGKSALAAAKGHKLSAKAGVTVTGGVTVKKSVTLSQAAKKPTKH